MTKNERIAIVPGSFDPMTVGHIAIIEKAAQSYDKVYVAVMINDQKKYMFSLSERTQIAKASLLGLNNVFVISSEGWLWELAKELGACAIVKGYRNQKDFEYEQKMAIFNKEHYPDAETVLIKSESDMDTVSSTLVRERIVAGEALDGLLPKTAISAIYLIKSKEDSK